MEVRQRGQGVMPGVGEAEGDLRGLLSIPRDYKVLFLQGGASAQFALVPLNLAAPQSTVDYVNTGHWARKAIAEAGRYCTVRGAGDGRGNDTRAPPQGGVRLRPRAARAPHHPAEANRGEPS